MGRKLWTMVSAVLGMLVVLPSSAFAQGPGPDQHVLEAVRRSAEFHQVQRDNPNLALKPASAKTVRKGDYAVAVQALKDATGNTTVVATHFVDMRTGAVKMSRLTRIVVKEADTQDKAIFGQTVKKTASVTLSTDGKVDFVGTASDTGVLREATRFKNFADKVRDKVKNGCAECGTVSTASYAIQAPPKVTPMGWCEDVMNYLCAASGAVQCTFACAAFGVTPGGLACAVLCGMIATYGCSNTIKLVCG